MLSRLRLTRLRLAMINALVFAGVAAVAGFAFWFAFFNLEYGAVDSSLDAQSQAILAGLEDQNGNIRLDPGVSLPGETSQGIAVAVVLIGPDGRVLDSNRQIPAAAIGGATASQRSGTFSDAVVQGRHYRLLTKQLPLSAGSSGRIVLARALSEVDSTLLRLALLLAAVVAALSVAAALLGYWLAGRALRPVRVMAEAARDISEHDLHRRLQIDLPPDDELGELASTFNQMLQRLEAAFTGLRRFTADAAHELRAPLALLRGEAELVLRRPRQPAEYEASARTVLHEAERLSRTVDQLLLLARADAGALTARFDRVELGALVEETAERWRARAVQKGVELRVEAVEDGSLRGDPDLLVRLVDNLLDNAVRHTPAGGAVAVRLERSNGWLILHVSDTGPGIDPKLAPTLFDRFTRGDPARQRDSGGAGLGLALCSTVVAVHGGSIGLENGAAPGAHLVAKLPADVGSAPAAPSGSS